MRDQSFCLGLRIIVRQRIHGGMGRGGAEIGLHRKRTALLHLNIPYLWDRKIVDAIYIE
jgi:hypothetical protein